LKRNKKSIIITMIMKRK